MDQFIICKFKCCNKFLSEPVYLPCGNRICKIHVDTMQSSHNDHSENDPSNKPAQEHTVYEYTCDYCKVAHQIPKEGFMVDRVLRGIIGLNLHLSEKAKTTSYLLRNFESFINEFELINKDPENFIYDYFSKIKNNIDLERERLLKDINAISEGMLSQIKVYQEECIDNLSKLNEVIEKNKVCLIEQKNEMEKLKEQLKMPKPNMDSQEIIKLNETIKKNKLKLIKFIDSILMGKECYFIPHFQIMDKENFGDFKVINSERLDQANKLVKSDLFDSNILSTSQTFDLVKLCQFEEKKKFKLIYRASEDGFRAKDFHLNCNDQTKTLSIVKVKDCDNIFGGYTESSWDGSGTKNDKHAFIFSLVNKENRPIKINVDPDSHNKAITADPNFLQRFGNYNYSMFGHVSQGFEIVSNSDQEECSALLEHVYKHPLYDSDSAEAKKFLASSVKFFTSEIEVYHVH